MAKKKEAPPVEVTETQVYGKEAIVDAIYDAIQETKADAEAVLPASVANLTKKAISYVVGLEKELIIGAVADGEKVRFIGFGTFEQRHRQARKGRNPQSGKEIDIPAQDVPGFSPGKQFKDAVNPK